MMKNKRGAVQIIVLVVFGLIALGLFLLSGGATIASFFSIFSGLKSIPIWAWIAIAIALFLIIIPKR